ncbi:DNA translocase FtsK [bacterium]|nr:DNA translocase FtsK [bacterium]
MQYKSEIASIILLGMVVMLFLSLISFSPADLSILQNPPNYPAQNMIGIVGAWMGFGLYSLFGVLAYLVVFLGLGLICLHFFSRYETHISSRIIGCFVLLISLTVFFALKGIGSVFLKGLFIEGEIKFAGGIIGHLLSSAMLKFFGGIGTYIITTITFVAGVILISSYENFYFFLLQKVKRLKSYRVTKPLAIQKKATIPSISKSDILIKEESIKTIPEIKAPEPAKIYKDKGEEKFIPELFQAREKRDIDSSLFALPPLSLLNDSPAAKLTDDSYIYDNSKKLEKVLLEFGIEAKVTSVQKGPVITSYELEPGVGVKVQSIVSLSDDIALALRAPSVRIVAPIPGKAVMGIEIPNPTSRLVYLKEILQSKEFASLGAKSKLAVALGKDIRGNPLVADLKEMPHILIAGTTGSGKTICLHSLISSILCNAYPHEVKFLLIDPKMVELAPFSQIPHLFAPIVTMAKEAPAALQWIVEEMETRYGKLAEMGVRHIEKFNEKMHQEKNDSEKMPYIVVIIDELADLMVVASRKVEEMIMRIAQLSRAAGIHLILATQRPSVDVVTGVIKANFPYRISFQVSSRVDSRTVLDEMGADKLLGKGDMLYLAAGGKPIRVQGPFVAEDEIERVVKYLEKMGKPDFSEISFKLDKVNKKEEPVLPAEKDPLFKDAIKVILASGQASASHLQRRMSIGYARAGRLIDLMEKQGIIGPPQGVKPRIVLIDESYLDKLNNNDNANIKNEKYDRNTVDI